MKPESARSAAIVSGHALAYRILEAALGNERAQALWDHWTPSQRAEVAEFAEDHFGPQLRSLADELVAWKERHDDA